MAKERPDTSIVTGMVRFSFLTVFAPKLAPGAVDPKYSVQLIIDKDDTFTLNKMKRAMNAAIEQGVSSLWGGKKPKGLKLPIRDGDEEKEGDDTYEGKYFCNCSAKNKPGLVDQDREDILDSTELKSGDFGRVSINFYAFDKNGNRGIAIGLNNLQKLKDGPALGGGRMDAADEFADNEGLKPGGKKTKSAADDDLPF